MSKADKLLQQKQQELVKSTEEVNALQIEHLNELDLNPKYSLDVDPENKYNMTKLKKDFVRHYIEFRNVNTAAELCGIDQDTAKQFFIDYAVQCEIRRINLALYQRQFASRLLTLDEIGGYLSSLLTNEFVPLAERLTTTEKLRVVDMIIKLNEMKKDGMNNPSNLMNQNINVQIKNLSVATIKQLLDTSNQIPAENVQIIDKIDEQSTLSPEEKSYLETLSTSDLLQILDDNNKTKEGGSENE